MTKHPVTLILKASLVGAALLTLSACATGGEPAAPTAISRTDTEQWRDRIKVDGQADEILLATHLSGVSANQDQALRALVDRWLSAEARQITVSAPVGGDDPAAAGRMAGDIRQRLLLLGAPAARVQVVGYDAQGQIGAPVRVSFDYYVAEALKCGQSWENLTATRKNEAYDNFGCAMAANLAAQVANPEDLIRPRNSTPIDAGRRDTVLGKYRKGEITSSARDEQAVGTVSKAIN